MDWQGENDTAIAIWIGNNAPSEKVFAPFLSLYDRYSGITDTYLATRIDQQVLDRVRVSTWITAWKDAGKFKADQTYVQWLLDLADREVLKNRLIEVDSDSDARLLFGKTPAKLKIDLLNQGLDEIAISCLLNEQTIEFARAVNALEISDCQILREWVTANQASDTADATPMRKSASLRAFRNIVERLEGLVGVKWQIRAMPASAGELNDWLSAIVMSEQSRQLLNELFAIFNCRLANEVVALQTLEDIAPAIDSSLGDPQFPSLRHDQLQKILRRPWLVLDLQRRLLQHAEIENRPPSTNELARRLEICHELGPAALRLPVSFRLQKTDRRYYLRAVGLLTILTLGCLLAASTFGLLSRYLPTGKPSSRWSEQVKVVGSASVDDVLDELSEELKAWFDEEPQSVQQLRNRLSRLKSRLADFEECNLSDLSVEEKTWIASRINELRDDLAQLDELLTAESSQKLLTLAEGQSRSAELVIAAIDSVARRRFNPASHSR